MSSPSPPLSFFLEHYEGPLDLLLDLIRKQQINIYDIPIATITAQYLEYMATASSLNIELSSEFVYMAATLIHVKSRLLLPVDPELQKMSALDEDPRQELVEQLIQHQSFKSAAEMLQQKRIIEEAVWSHPQIEQFVNGEEQPGLTITVFDLVKTLQSVLERSKSRPLYEVGKDQTTVPEMIRFLREALSGGREGRRRVSATQLFEHQSSQHAMICLFLAMLELVKRQIVELVQSEAFGEIELQLCEIAASGTAAVEQMLSDEELAAVQAEYQ